MKTKLLVCGTVLGSLYNMDKVKCNNCHNAMGHCEELCVSCHEPIRCDHTDCSYCGDTERFDQELYAISMTQETEPDIPFQSNFYSQLEADSGLERDWAV